MPSLVEAAPASGHVDAVTLRRWLRQPGEIALLDVREHGQYGEGHPFFAVNAPYSRLEIDILRLVPRRGTRIVLFDDGEPKAPVALRAARRLRALGYADLFILDGGAPAWEASGMALFKGVNVPSKTFGEVVEHAFDVPHIGAAGLKERLAAGEPVALLDGRTLDEHRRMTLPGAVPVPNGELALRWASLVDDDTTPIVVHCAGRTRSIVGAQMLRDLGVPNPVYALENGTQGWALAGLVLEHGSPRRMPPSPATGSVAQQAVRIAAASLDRAGALVLSVASAQQWLDDPDRTTFVFDVRTPEEFAAGSLEGARHAPGGQLIQALDLQVGVRGARILLIDDDGIRARMIALWLHRLGWQAAAVTGGVASGLRIATAPGSVGGSAALAIALRRADAAALTDFQELVAHGQAVVLDLRASQTHRKSHPVGAVWSIRPRVKGDAANATGDRKDTALLLLADDADIARLAAQDLRDAGWSRLAWTSAESTLEAGWQSVSTQDAPSDADAIDFLRFVHDRHDGNLDAARRYLEWETGLIAQCAPDELASFRLPAAPNTAL